VVYHHGKFRDWFFHQFVKFPPVQLFSLLDHAQLSTFLTIVHNSAAFQRSPVFSQLSLRPTWRNSPLFPTQSFRGITGQVDWKGFQPPHLKQSILNPPSRALKVLSWAGAGWKKAGLSWGHLKKGLASFGGLFWKGLSWTMVQKKNVCGPRNLEK
jgi:hypothetical protein